MYFRKINEHQYAFILEEEDQCFECRYSGRTRLAPCGFIYAASQGYVPAIPMEDETDKQFVMHSCGAFCPMLKEVKSEDS